MLNHDLRQTYTWQWEKLKYTWNDRLKLFDLAFLFSFCQTVKVNNYLSIWLFLCSFFLFSLRSSASFSTLYTPNLAQAVSIYYFFWVLTALFISARAVVSLSQFYLRQTRLLHWGNEVQWTVLHCHAHPQCCSDPGDHPPLRQDNVESWGEGERDQQCHKNWCRQIKWFD